MKVALAVPSYGGIPPVTFSSIIQSLMYAANRGIKWSTFLNPDKLPFRSARTQIHRAILEWPGGPESPSYPDGVLWVDSDMVVPVEGFWTLLNRGVEFISGLYYHRGEPHHPVCGRLTPDLKTVQWCLGFDKAHLDGKVYEMSATGFGILYTSSRILANVPKDVFYDETMGEDVAFCKAVAERKLAQLYIDTAVVCKHLGEPVQIGPDHFDVDKAGKMLYAMKQEELEYLHGKPNIP